MSKLGKTIAGACLALGLGLAPTLASATTLSFVSWMKDDPSYGPWWEAVIAKFEADHPGDKIEWTKVARSEYANTMFTMFAGGNPPDIVHLAAFEYQPFANEGWIEDLGPWVAKSGISLDGWAGQSTCEWAGKTQCIMLLYTGYVLAYNEKLLKDAGYDHPPVGWDEYIAAAKATTKDTDGNGVADQFGVGLPTKDKAGLMYGMLSFVIDQGGGYTVDGKAAFDTPPVIEGLRRLKEIYKEGLLPKDQTSGEIRQLFTEGKIAMAIDGPWIYGNIGKADDTNRPNLKLSMSPFSPPVGGTSNVITMPADLAADKKELVWDFIKIAVSKDMQQKFASLTSQPAPMPGLDYSAEIAKDANFETIVKATEAAAAAKIDRLPKGLELNFGEVQSIFFDNVQKMFIQDLDPADVGASIQKEVLAIR